MTSKEAYNVLLQAWHGRKDAKDYPNFDDIAEALDNIEQALERLEKIENLKTTPNALETSLAKYMNKCIKLEKENQNLQLENKLLEHSIEEKMEIIADLKLENQKLKEKCKRIIETSHDLNVSLKQYQKAIENFIDYLNEDKTKIIAKYSIKETFNKIFKEVLGD